MDFINEDFKFKFISLLYHYIPAVTEVSTASVQIGILYIYFAIQFKHTVIRDSGRQNNFKALLSRDSVWEIPYFITYK